MQTGLQSTQTALTSETVSRLSAVISECYAAPTAAAAAAAAEHAMHATVRWPITMM